MRVRDVKSWPFFVLAAFVPFVTERIERGSWPAGASDWLSEVVSGVLIVSIGMLAIRRIASEQEALRRANAKLERIAHTDALTGLGNRTAWHEALAGWDDSPVPRWLLVADVDRLKPVNDLKGHAAGDLLLQRAGAVLLETVSRGEGSRVFRTGGDEFAMLLATDDPRTAEWAAARIIGAMKNDPDGASFSIGLAFLEPGAGSAIEAAMRADAALYQAKRAGGGAWRAAPNQQENDDETRRAHRGPFAPRPR